MQLSRIIDPRDALQRARKTDIVRYAKANGITEIHPEMPGEVMKQILRSKGITAVPLHNPQRLGALPQRPTGAPPQVPAEGKVNTIDAVDDLRRQWEAQQIAKHLEEEVERVKAKEKPVNEITQLRRECKARGIKMARTDKIPDLRAKLNGTSKPA